MHLMVFPLYDMKCTSGSGVTMASGGVFGNICLYVLIGRVFAPEPVSTLTLIGPQICGLVLDITNSVRISDWHVSVCRTESLITMLWNGIV